LDAHQRWHQDRAPRFHHIQRFIIEKRAVLNRIDPRPYSSLCAFAAVGVSCRLAA
jgi:hypothetical protein